MADSIFFRSAINGFNKTDVLDYIKGLVEKNAGLTSEIERLKAEIDGLKQAAEEQSKISAEAQPDEQDIEKLSEQKLGKVMYDARRFSDLIVKEANDRADFIFANASQSTEEMNERLSVLKKEAESFISSFDSGMAQITEKLALLENSLVDFSLGITEEKTEFNDRIGTEG